MTEEKIKEDMLMMQNTQSEVVEYLNSKSDKRMKISDKDKGQLGPGSSGLVSKSCLQNDLAMMFDSSSEDEGQEIPHIDTDDVIFKKQLQAKKD